MISGKNNGKINSVYIQYSPHLEGGADGKKEKQTDRLVDKIKEIWYNINVNKNKVGVNYDFKRTIARKIKWGEK